jgi:DNA-binding CsgD family transcriptional regulator
VVLVTAFGAFPPAGLVGRQRDLQAVWSFAEHASVSGGGLVVAGEPGAGKTTLLDAVAAEVAAAGTKVLRAAGVKYEAGISYAGLNLALQPLAGSIALLDSAYRDALRVVFGLEVAVSPDRYTLCNAFLELLHREAADQPVLLLVDDLQWLDRPSAAVFGFAARRAVGSRVGFIGIIRSGDEGFFDRAGLAEHELAPLTESASAELLDHRFPSLDRGLRDRVLADAMGNPLALVELPTVSGVFGRSRRLRATFGSGIAALPALTRHVLLLAALEGTGSLTVLERASQTDILEALAPAEAIALVRVDAATMNVSFRHPVTRSAVAGLVSTAEQRHAHRQLAAALAEDPERRAWHLANAVVRRDEQMAASLEEAAYRLLRRGDPVGAVAALTRAADLSPTDADRARRLADAAYVGAGTAGGLAAAPAVLREAHRADPGLSHSLDAAVATAYVLLNTDGDIDTSHRILVGAIEAARQEASSVAALIEALHMLCLVCFFGGRAELWQPLDAAIDRLGAQAPPSLELLRRLCGDPAYAGTSAVIRLDAAVAGLHGEPDPAEVIRVGTASCYVDRLAGCRAELRRVAQNGRENGDVATAVRAAQLLAFEAYFAGHWDAADSLLTESLSLCEQHGYRLFEWCARYVQALLAAARGDDASVRFLTDEITRRAVPRGVLVVPQYCSHAKALAALGRGAFDEAYREVASISPPGTLPALRAHALWVILDLVEAAARTGRTAEAAAHAATVSRSQVRDLSGRLALLSSAAEGLAADSGMAAACFERALRVPDADRWPFDLARVRLLYGEHLRRVRAYAQARVHLGAALDAFQRLGAVPWARRAAAELRVAGVQPGHPEGPTGKLTSQEREIARLAATGMTNKQIAERLFLSDRTVSAHLYRAFPKLGITSRAALRDALTALGEQEEERAA